MQSMQCWQGDEYRTALDIERQQVLSNLEKPAASSTKNAFLPLPSTASDETSAPT